MIGFSSITLSELEKSLEMEVYLIQKLCYSIELKIRTLYVSLMFTTSVSGSDLHSSFLPIFVINSENFSFLFFLGLTRTAIAFICGVVFFALTVICVAVLVKAGVFPCWRKTTDTKLTSEINLSEQNVPLRAVDFVRTESSV